MKKIMMALALVLMVTGLSAQSKILYDFKATTLDGQNLTLVHSKGRR